jgi:hypothetical protein
MSVHCCPRTIFASLLVFASLVVGSSFGGVAGAGAQAQPVASAGDSHGNPRAVPPILPPATPSELAVIRRVEAQEAAARAYRLSASATYSLAELNAYASARR